MQWHLRFAAFEKYFTAFPGNSDGFPCFAFECRLDKLQLMGAMLTLRQ